MWVYSKFGEVVGEGFWLVGERVGHYERELSALLEGRERSTPFVVPNGLDARVGVYYLRIFYIWLVAEEFFNRQVNLRIGLYSKVLHFESRVEQFDEDRLVLGVDVLWHIVMLSEEVLDTLPLTLFDPPILSFLEDIIVLQEQVSPESPHDSLFKLID